MKRYLQFGLVFVLMFVIAACDSSVDTTTDTTPDTPTVTPEIILGASTLTYTVGDVLDLESNIASATDEFGDDVTSSVVITGAPAVDSDGKLTTAGTYDVVYTLTIDSTEYKGECTVTVADMLTTTWVNYGCEMSVSTDGVTFVYPVLTANFWDENAQYPLEGTSVENTVEVVFTGDAGVTYTFKVESSTGVYKEENVVATGTEETYQLDLSTFSEADKAGINNFILFRYTDLGSASTITIKSVEYVEAEVTEFVSSWTNYGCTMTETDGVYTFVYATLTGNFWDDNAQYSLNGIASTDTIEVVFTGDAGVTYTFKVESSTGVYKEENVVATGTEETYQLDLSTFSDADKTGINNFILFRYEDLGSASTIVVKSVSVVEQTATTPDTSSKFVGYAGEADLSPNSISYWMNTTTDLVEATYTDATDTLKFSANQASDGLWYGIQLFSKGEVKTDATTYDIKLSINSSVAGSITINGTVWNLVVGDNTIEYTLSSTANGYPTISIQFAVDGSTTIGNFSTTIVGLGTFTEATSTETPSGVINATLIGSEFYGTQYFKAFINVPGISQSDLLDGSYTTTVVVAGYAAASLVEVSIYGVNDIAVAIHLGADYPSDTSTISYTISFSKDGNLVAQCVYDSGVVVVPTDLELTVDSYAENLAESNLAINQVAYWINDSTNLNSASFDSTTGTLYLSANQLSTAAWYETQVFYKGAAITEGGTYIITLNVKMNVACDITINGVVYAMVVGENIIEIETVYIVGAYPSISIQFGTQDSDLSCGNFSAEISGFKVSSSYVDPNADDEDTDTVKLTVDSFAANVGQSNVAENQVVYWINDANNIVEVSFDELLGMFYLSALQPGDAWYETQVFYKSSAIEVAGTYTYVLTIKVNIDCTIRVNSVEYQLTAGEEYEIEITEDYEAGDIFSVSIQFGTTDLGSCGDFSAEISGFKASSSYVAPQVSTTSAFIFSQYVTEVAAASDLVAGQVALYHDVENVDTSLTGTYDSDTNTFSLVGKQLTVDTSDETAVVDTYGLQFNAKFNAVSTIAYYNETITINSNVAGSIIINNKKYTLVVGDNVIELNLFLQAGENTSLTIYFATSTQTLGNFEITIKGLELNQPTLVTPTIVLSETTITANVEDTIDFASYILSATNEYGLSNISFVVITTDCPFDGYGRLSTEGTYKVTYSYTTADNITTTQEITLEVLAKEVVSYGSTFTLTYADGFNGWALDNVELVDYSNITYSRVWISGTTIRMRNGASTNIKNTVSMNIATIEIESSQTDYYVVVYGVDSSGIQIEITASQVDNVYTYDMSGYEFFVLNSKSGQSYLNYIKFTEPTA